MYKSAYTYHVKTSCWRPWNGTAFIWDNSILPWQKCIGVPCRVTWSTGWAYKTVPNSCKVGAECQLLKYTYMQWTFHVLSHRPVSGHSCTQRGWRHWTVKESKHTEFLGYTALNFDVQCPRCYCVLSHFIGTYCECTTVLYVISAVPHVVQLGRQTQTEYAVILNEDMAHSTDNVKHFLAFWVGTVTMPFLFSLPQSTWPRSHYPLKQLQHEDQFCNREDILTIVWHNTAQMSMSGDANVIHHFSHHWQWIVDNLKNYF